ncbi:MAG: DUF2163 domain-containing protein [Xanthomonadales bacterium]|jgi:uncharacterized phage protein (TIGR02218 family)|nr:DUF2163 domain-containing protein [Xanthomonadales bacterium]
MTFAAVETSVQSGRPVEIYEFLNGATYYRYTSADGDVVYGGNTYTAVPISRNAVEATAETARLALKITCARTLGVLDLFSLLPPDDIVAVTVRRLHAGDGNAITLWLGRVLNVTWSLAAAEIHCESVYTSLKRVGLRRMYQKQCPHVVYGPGCALVRATWKATKTVSTITGAAITTSSLGVADGYYAGGYLEWERAAGHFDRRSIRSQVGNVVTVSFQIPGLSVSDIVYLYPGCDHTLATCESKFANRLNYGGMPYFPDLNPFNGASLY